MPQKTQNYKLDYFKQGSYYSGGSDYTRFVTLDYNTESYVGVAGIGVISGWTIESVSGLTIQIIPGTGIINGFYAESPYVVKQRSGMVNGDREIEVLNENDIPEPSLTPTQRSTYVAVIQLYDPSFSPVGDIENSYVKVVVPTSIVLANNTDTYIYAQFPNGTKPYPPLADYPPPAGGPPVRSDYDTYDEYKVALNVYNAKLTAIHNYEWYTNPANHFTAVEFVTSGSFISSSSRVLLGRVVTRNLSVSKIDISGVNNLANFESLIRKFATEFLVEHKHGGNLPFDPPKVRLETDIRDAVLFKYNDNDGNAIYSVLEVNNTSITLGHRHTYQVDSNGNGQTIEQFGSTDSHFHKISGYIVGQPEYSINNITAHIHTVESASSDDSWTSNSRFLVYLNDEIFGDETTSYIHADSANKRITFDKGISATNNRYSTAFNVTLKNPVNGATETKSYSYSAKDVSVYNFMLKMMQNYNDTFAVYYDEEIYYALSGSDVTNVGIVAENLASNPFLIVTYDAQGNAQIAGLQDLQSQSSAAQTLLKNVGDSFTFTPNAARNITIVLTEGGSNIDRVQLEILDNTEVTGKLRTESILYLNANKILAGEFVPQVIPFVSHAGRILEECLPLQHVLISNDGIRYTAVPTITSLTLGHKHKLLIDKDISGATSDVLVNNDVVYYQNDTNDNTYFVYHAHGVQDSVVSNASSDGLLNWISNVSSTNVTSSVHTHEVIYPVIGNAKTIYAIKEDIEGNIYVGTSDGFIIIPSAPSYQFVINGLSFSFYGSDLWTLLVKAGAQYEKDTGNTLSISESVYGDQIDDALVVLSNDGDSVLLTGTPYPDRPTDSIMIKKISNFQMPDFKYIQIKDPSEVLNYETVIGTTQSNVNGEESTEDIVERDFNDVPMWSVEINSVISQSQNYIASNISTDVIVAGSNIIAKSVGLNKTPYQTWNSINLPFAVNVIRKMIKDPDKNYWICTNNGVMVSRYYSQGNIFSILSPPLGNPDVLDIISGERGSIYCCSSSGLFKTIDGGKTWIKIFDVIGGFKQITRDRKLDKTNVVSGHYHNFDVNNDGDGFLGESIGSGILHVHTVASWVVAETMGHTHTDIVTLYALDNDKIIWKSMDNGGTWIEYGSLPDGECGDLFAAFGSLFVSQKDGLYRSQNGSSWSKILNNRAYTYEWSYDLSELFIGSDNILYGTLDGNSFSSLYTFGGQPNAILVSNNSKQYFGYAYSNASQSFHFKDLVLNTGELTALVDFSRWYATGGGWASNILYDVYINNKRVLSTKFNEDKRNALGYHFSVIPVEGTIDFSAETVLSKRVSVFDSNITVSNSAGFARGDLILVASNSASFYSTIDAISGTDFSLDSRVTVDISLPGTVRCIPNVDGSSDILVNVYNSLLSNIGMLTHDQVEDGLSNYSDGRPYKFNDSYLSNLLQLTQAVRYVYPDINSKFVNDMFYDFRYSWSPSNPLYPSIYDYIDVVNSEVCSQKFYDSGFIARYAKSLNKILIGYGSFSGLIFVATDIGLFYAQLTPSYEANWFYVTDLPYATYDIIIFGIDTLFVATSNGTYRTSDAITWSLESAPAINYPSYSLGLRWFNQGQIIVPAHTAQFESNVFSNTGTIIASSGTPYSVLINGQGIKISGSGDKNGDYVIQSIGDTGIGFGSKMIVQPAFPGTTETKTGVIITMGTWWEQWNGDVNTLNADLTNTLLVGGADNISYNDGGDVSSWRGSSFGSASNFISRKFRSLTNGRALLSATGTLSYQQINYLFKTDNIGQNWDILKRFSQVEGSINSVSVSDFNNTVLKVTYASQSPYVYANGNFDQLNISIFRKGVAVAIFKGKVIWNEKRDNVDTITVFGNDLYSMILSLTDCIFIVYPPQINDMTETSENTLIFGTDRGLYYDVNTVVSNAYPQGNVITAGYDGVISKIDISGTIISISRDIINNRAAISVSADSIIRAKDLIGKYVYVTDTNPVEKYLIVTNNSLSPGAESTIIVNFALPSSYVGKKIRIIGSNSRAFVNFNLPVSTDQFRGGTLTIASDGYNNKGKIYGIASNGTNYVDLSEALIPFTTLVDKNSDIVLKTDTPLQVGQSVKLLDSSNKITLWVALDRNVKENVLKDLTYVVTDESLPSVTVLSNWNNSVTLDSNDVLKYSNNNSFVLQGTAVEQVGGFSHLLTSVESGHYHGVEMVNAIVSGQIQSFANVGASYVDLLVTNTQNFNIPIVQLQGNLFEDAQIVFTTPQNINLRYVSEVVSHTPTSIRVRIKSSSYWNFLVADPLLISAGWNWEIDGTNYGYTNGITYDDFAVFSVGITSTANSGSNTVKVLSTVGINIGDKIRIQDDTLSYEINYVSGIPNTTTLTVSYGLSKTYFNKSNPQMKVLRDIFTNTHMHQIRDNESQNLLISDYVERGYPPEHSHRILPLIADVSTLLNQGNRIWAFGSGSVIYSSIDNADIWQEVIDVNSFVEGFEEVSGISTATLNNDKLVVGATNGSLFVQGDNGDIVVLSNPI